MKLFDLLQRKLDEFLTIIYDQRATESLEALCNDERVMAQWAAESPEWQPYPVPPEKDFESETKLIQQQVGRYE